MRRSVSVLVALAVAAGVLVGSVSLSARGKREAKQVKLVAWIAGRDSYIGPDEQKKAQEEWYISQAFRRFEKANPGVTVDLVVPPDPAEAHQTFKAAAVAGDAPDVANLWSGQYIFAIEEAIKDITALVSKDDLQNIIGWDTVREDFKPDGKILGYPASECQICIFLYNKALVKKAGLDFEANPPRTTQAFDEAMAKLAKVKTDAGKPVIPIVTDENFPWFYLYLGAYWWYQVSGVERILSDCATATKFTDDKGFIDTVTYYASLYKRGWVNKDAATSTDSMNTFLQGQAVMIPQVPTVIGDAIKALGEENVGVMLPPEFDPNAKVKNGTIGGPGQCMVVSTSSKNPELAVKLMSFINSKAESLELQKFQPKVTLRKDITEAELKYAPGSISSKLLGYSKNYVYFVDNILTPGVVDEFYKYTPLALVGKMTPKQVADMMDKKAAENAAAAKK